MNDKQSMLNDKQSMLRPGFEVPPDGLHGSCATRCDYTRPLALRNALRG
ncbi:hypothetical protein ACPC54_15195 [Kitasatospora sp. NPDC094028]